MWRKYKLHWKTWLLFLMIWPFRRKPFSEMTPAMIRQARKPLPRFFLINWVLGKPRGCDIQDQQIPVRDGSDIRIRIYRPRKASKGPLPLILNFHGGGWALGTLQNNDFYCAELARHVQALVISVDYRLAPENKFPTAVEDAYDALLWAHAHADSLGADPGRIGVTGDSAGGNLAAAITLMSREEAGPAIAYQFLIYPATNSRLDFPSLDRWADAPILKKADIFRYLNAYVSTEEDKASPYLSPFRAESLRDLPPATVVTAEYDPLCDDGRMYAERLQAEGVPTEWKEYPKAIHGFFTFPNHCPQSRPATRLAVDTFRKAFGS